MSLMDKVKEAASNQFIEVIEWLDESKDTLLYRFPVYQQEIKNGAQLIVRESQAAVFVFEGQVADVFTPGRYTVEGGNTPILSKLGAWKYGFNSPIKSEVYFVNTKQFTDMKRGTSNPIMLRDADFGIGGDHQPHCVLERHGGRGARKTGKTRQQRCAKQQRRTSKRQSSQLHGFPPKADYSGCGPLGPTVD